MGKTYHELGKPPTKKAPPYFGHKTYIPWLLRAAHINHAALRVALLLAHARSLAQGDEEDLVVLRWLRDYHGLSIDMYGRGLKALQSYGLVSIERHPSKPALITLLDFDQP
jgi:hypothetical protein